MNWAAIVWLILMLVFLAMEATTVSLVTIWFAVGALAAMIASLLDAQLWLQILLFLAVSVALLACLRPMVRKFIKPKITATNIDAIIGSQGIVTTDIENVAAQGQVKVGAMTWSARSTSGASITAGTKIRVDKIEGVKLLVSPVEIEEKV